MPVRSTSGSLTCTSIPTHERCYVVRRGDTLSGIAFACHVELSDLLAANPQIRDPNKIFPGQELRIPTAGTEPEAPPAEASRDVDAFYLVRRGDSLSRIAARHGVSLQDIIAANPQIRDPNLINVNDRIAIPGLDASTRGALGALRARAAIETEAASGETGSARGTYTAKIYPPHDESTYALFEEAARLIGVPEWWARSSGLHNILRKESGGKVGVPNEKTYGFRSTNPRYWPEVHEELRRGIIRSPSSASGLGQLLLSNVDIHYPDGRDGIGDPLNEAAGMLSYIKSRYGNPNRAWELYGVYHQGY